MKTTHTWFAALLGVGALVGSIFWWKKASATPALPQKPEGLPLSPYSAFVTIHDDPVSGKKVQVFDNMIFKPAFNALLQKTVSEGQVDGFPVAVLNSPPSGRTLQQFLDANQADSSGNALLVSTNVFVPSVTEMKIVRILPGTRTDLILNLVQPNANYALVD